MKRLGLEAHLPRLQAREIRERLEISGQKIPRKMLYELILTETDDPDQAEEAYIEVTKGMLRAGITPD